MWPLGFPGLFKDHLGFKTAQKQPWISDQESSPRAWVDCSHLVWSIRKDRDLLPGAGASPRASSVLYDRAGSAISMIKPGEVDWTKVFSGSKHFHISASPCPQCLCQGGHGGSLKAAKKADCTVSYDLNYRRKLWTPAEAKKIQEPMMAHVDILITTEEDTNVVFGIKEKDYEIVAEKLARTFHFKVVAITLREDLSVWRNHWTAIAYQDGKIFRDRTYEVEIVDRVGAGDSFTAGFLYGWGGRRMSKKAFNMECLCGTETYSAW